MEKRKDQIIDTIWKILPALPTESPLPIPRFLIKNKIKEVHSTSKEINPNKIKEEHSTSKEIELETLPEPVKKYIVAMAELLKKDVKEVMMSDPAINYMKVYGIEVEQHGKSKKES